jgi:hypothetical protein
MNLVKVNTSGISYEVDIDQEWKEFKESEFDCQLESASSWNFWMTQLFGVDLPQETKNKFWNEFQKPAAGKARIIAVYGLKWANYADHFSLLKSAIDLIKDRDDGKLADKAEDALLHFASIGMRFAEMTARRDHRDFRRMAELIKDGGIPSGKRCGEDELNAEIMREFTIHFRNTRTLPTKKQLREAVGENDAERFRKSLFQLGLSGLPQSSKAGHPS